jgi:hypothetical protein
MEERELTQLLQQLGDRVTPGPAPVRRIVDAGEALRARRSGRVRVFAVAAAAAAVVGGGSIAATVLDLPSMTMSTQDSAGGGADGAGGGDNAAEEAAPDADSGGGAGGGDEGAAAADAALPAPVTPDVAEPGDRVEIGLPADVAFGAEWSLERSVDGAWKPQFVLVDAEIARESGVPLARPADSPQALASIPEQKDGPVTLVLPEAATPGSYRICQSVDDATAWCGLLTVTG